MNASSDYRDTFYTRTKVAARAFPTLEADGEVETCIIGGGLAGVSTAYELAERGRSVVLLEARRIGWGASGRNGGFVSAGFALSSDALLRRVGLDRARALYELSRRAVAIMGQRIAEIPLAQVVPSYGKLRVSRVDDADGVKRTRDRAARDFDEELIYWDKDQLRAHLKTERYFQALQNPHGFHFHPLNYVLGLAQQAESLGAMLHESSPVIRLQRQGAAWRVETPGGCLMAKQVVVACGGYLERLVPALARSVLPISTYVVTTEPLGERLRSAIDTPMAVSDGRWACDYYRRVEGDRILWGGRITARTAEPADLAVSMLGDLLKVYPQLRGVRAETCWGGLMSYAPHKMPLIGTLEPGLWYALGFGGHGMNTTTMAGDLIASALAEDDDRYRLFDDFGLTNAGGRLGPLAIQCAYWIYQARDAWRERRER